MSPVSIKFANNLQILSPADFSKYNCQYFLHKREMQMMNVLGFFQSIHPVPENKRWNFENIDNIQIKGEKMMTKSENME